MFKLTVVSGPSRGANYALREGTTTLGRAQNNSIVLASGKISKQHCSLEIEKNELGWSCQLQDLGSSNGTFVNGALIKQKKLHSGDKLSVGEYVFEFSSTTPESQALVPVSGNLSPALQFPGGGSGLQSTSSSAEQGNGMNENAMPKDLKGKALWYFELYVMPIFYQAIMKKQWRVICLSLAGVFIIGNLLISVSPLLDANQKTLIAESARRARLIARQIADRNSAYLAARQEVKTDIGILAREDNVQLAMLIDLDNRIIAPSTRMNQYLATGLEAQFAVQMKEHFKAGRESGAWKKVSVDSVVAVEPVKIFDSATSRNVIVAMAIVALDITQITPGYGELGMAYSEVLLFTGLLGAIILYIIYRITLKPLFVLNDDIDEILKGNMSEVTHEFKWSELDKLWTNINSAMQRVPKSSGDGLGYTAQQTYSPEEYLGVLGAFGTLSNAGILACDNEKKVVMINTQGEDITGIRQDAAIGRTIPEVARDQAFGSLANDIFERVQTGTEGICEDFEFSGIAYKVYAAAFGNPAGTAKCFVLMLARNAEG